MLHVLVVDDDAAVGLVLQALLTQAGYRASLARSAQAALSMMLTQLTDLVLSDLRMPELDGLGLLESLKRSWPEVPVVMLTAHGTVQNAVAAMRAGARDFLLKPFEREDVLATIARVLSASDAKRAAPPGTPPLVEALVGNSPAQRELAERIHKAAQGSSSVLLQGEAGSGKQLAARLIHQHGQRAGRELVTVELSTMPQGLVERELFGYSATGEGTKRSLPASARASDPHTSGDRPGRFELARGGTLLLKDVDALSLSAQTRLLALLRQASMDVRLLSTARPDLALRVKSGLFREDLYYALSVVPIWLVPLRDRSEDVPALVSHFLRSFAALHCEAEPIVSDDAWPVLLAYRWPGNVRELASLMERLLVLHAGRLLERPLVEAELRQRAELQPAQATQPGTELQLESKVHETERVAIVHALEKARGNRTLAARLLGVSRRTLYNKLNEHGIP